MSVKFQEGSLTSTIMPMSSYCAAYLTEEGCTLQNCPQRHNVRKCSCGVVIPSKHFEAHIAGKRHRRELVLERLRASASLKPASLASTGLANPANTVTQSQADNMVQHNHRPSRGTLVGRMLFSTVRYSHL